MSDPHEKAVCELAQMGRAIGQLENFRNANNVLMSVIELHRHTM